MREYCQFIDDPPLYYERGTLHYTHTLATVLLVARHGERAPLAAEALLEMRKETKESLFSGSTPKRRPKGQIVEHRLLTA